MLYELDEPPRRDPSKKEFLCAYVLARVRAGVDPTGGIFLAQEADETWYYIEERCKCPDASQTKATL